jgi:hypothetical protein
VHHVLQFVGVDLLSAKANALVECCNSFLWRVARGCKHHYIFVVTKETVRELTPRYEEQVSVAMVVQVLRQQKTETIVDL